MKKRSQVEILYTYKNLVYDLAHHESPIAQWLERPTGNLEGHGFDSRWGLRKQGEQF